MGGDMRYEIGQNAYIKLVLQALNHKTSAVNGLLLGRLSAYNNDLETHLSHLQVGSISFLEVHFLTNGPCWRRLWSANDVLSPGNSSESSLDLQETKDALAIASDLPLSILIVGDIGILHMCENNGILIMLFGVALECELSRVL
ncbi:hypothetical protein RHSIM_Rhsim13G0193100 [Rhododendron simsii]|uniref:Uncharacterized protein n=1 Tax=Rhododendron simsii TaxID=118357 RepID=A0A834L7I1_RHOSS|nr:hypothetical protein RHSIM_Rhsim13G0193100 [Rhododendron simsii]